MRMNVALPAMVQTPNFAETIMRGREMQMMQQQMQTQNALAGYLRDNGGAIMSGDPNALAGLAAYDPSMALGIQRQNRQEAREERDYGLRERQINAGMANDDARLDMARQQAAQSAAEHGARMSAFERQSAAAEAQRVGAMATAARAQGEESWNAFIQSEEGADFAPFDFGNSAIAIAGVTGTVEGLGLGDGEQFTLGEGQTRYDAQGNVIAEGQTEGAWRQATPEEAAGYGAVAGQFGPDGKFDPINPPSGMSIETGPDGQMRVLQGPGVSANARPLNEGQSKNVIYATRAEGALGALETNAGALTSLPESVAQNVPLAGRYMQSPEYQQARQAADEFLSAILRKDTGAAITNQEMTIYGSTYLPMPGDTPELLTQKQVSRARAVEALRRGMTPAEILALEKPSASEPDVQMEPTAAPRVLRYNPETDGFE